MIEISKIEVYGWETAIRGMRNPMNSWYKSDSIFRESGKHRIGENDLSLMLKLIKAGPDHSKFLRMITVTCDIYAPLYWWKEFDTYKVGTVANSCSTMHKLASNALNLNDFSHEHLDQFSLNSLTETIRRINYYREKYLEDFDKDYWWQMIQLLPSSYNQKRTVQLNYQVLMNMCKARKEHKLDEWRFFCEVMNAQLPYFKEFNGQS